MGGGNGGAIEIPLEALLTGVNPGNAILLLCIWYWINSWHLSVLIRMSSTPFCDSGDGRLRLVALIGVGLSTLELPSTVECGLVKLSDGESTLIELFESVGDGGIGSSDLYMCCTCPAAENSNPPTDVIILPCSILIGDSRFVPPGI